MNAGPMTQLGRYQLTRVLGRGAMGLVYEALDPRLGRKVAVKTILKSHLADDALAREYSARFVREAQAAARLSHPHIVTVFDFGEEDEVAYIVMEYIEGRELAQHFEEHDFFDLPNAVRIVCELLEALAYAHERGIVHRDVKPANVMIEPGGHVKLTDFGVARLADSNADRTLPGTMVGTPSYMSPEQIQGLAVGSRTDLFAVGVILYQFLTHQRPFSGGGQWTIQRKIVSEEPMPPSFANAAVPPVFDAIVKRALAKNPDQRYQSAAAFADDLRRALASHPPQTPDPQATVVRGPAVSGDVRRRSLALAWAAVAGVGVATAGTWFAFRAGDAAVTPAPAEERSTPAASAPLASPETPTQAGERTTAPTSPPAAGVARPAPDSAQRPASAASLPRSTPTPARQDTGARQDAGSTFGGDRRQGPPAARGQNANRCADLLQRLQLGEDLSPANLAIFEKECKR